MGFGDWGFNRDMLVPSITAVSWPAWDVDLFRATQSALAGPWTNRFFWVCSEMVGEITLVFVSLAVAWWLRGRELRTWAGVLALSLVVSGAMTQGTKRVIQRERPAAVLGKENISMPYQKASRYSFPSGHSTSAMGLAVLVALRVPRFASWALMFGFLACLSRIVLGLHFPLDVLAGGAIGSATSLVCWIAATRKGWLAPLSDRRPGQIDMGSLFSAVPPKKS